jgi:SAM-dependent methyltransferase
MRQPYTDILPGQTGGQGRLASLIDPAETYGRHIIERFVSKLPKVESVIDLGAGRGHDLGIIKSVHPNVRTTAIEAGKAYASSLDGKVDQIEILDIERDVFPFQNESIDLIIANQILEHTKEVFWIFHEVTRCLKIGGHFIFGVPNVASFHNRILLLFGKHPTQHKMVSAHVRPFTKADVLLFMNSCFPQGYSLESFAGSQFYPFPKCRQISGLDFPHQCLFHILHD